MTTLEILLTQIAISLVVVILYHLWASRHKPPAPITPAPNLNLNPNLKSLSPAHQAAPPASPLPASPVPAVAAQVPTPPEIIAAIAAAIAVVIGPHRVVAIQQIAAPAPDVNVWALEGRMKHFMSHKVR
ncbi:MAG TPA: hypothetical protein VN765_16260 [Candidatus Acidoferrum sp.]|nr:hypothetical protein [Candidatus Acidoferrum sp.]